MNKTAMGKIVKNNHEPMVPNINGANVINIVVFVLFESANQIIFTKLLWILQHTPHKENA